MRPYTRLLSAAAIAAALLTLTLSSPTFAQTGSVTGIVTDSTGAALANAEVRLDGTTFRTTSDEAGRFRLTDIPGGLYTLRVLALGYRATTRPVTVAAASAQPGYCDACREEYGAKTLVDTEVGYKFPLVDFSIGARNLFDTYPDQPKDDFNNNFATFPWAAASPFGYNGRYIYTRASLDLVRR